MALKGSFNYEIGKSISSKNSKNTDEQTAWLRLTPAKRIQETTKLWQLYRALGGKLGPESDPQSPFYSMYFSHLTNPKT